MTKGKDILVHSFRVVVVRANIARPICDSLIGEGHTTKHRIVTGSVVMVIGVSIAHLGPYAPCHYLTFILDTVGYGIHALGTTPFIEHIIHKYRSAELAVEHDAEKLENILHLSDKENHGTKPQ
jgi:hypothetical protein